MKVENKRRDWPDEGLEHLRACPICGGLNRHLLHENLVDHLFDTPGHWNLHKCGRCETGYLNPRPDTQTIHQAYYKYYTHQSQLDDDPNQIGTDWRSSLKQAILRAYIRRKFGHQRFRLTDALAGVMWFRPWLKMRFNGAMRHLPIAAGGRTVLDIGCGNGRFLGWARAAGWEGVGTEFDPQAAEVARSKGFEVHEGLLDDLISAGRKFDAVTISHVIEHVHDPRALLRAALHLLKPNGHFWIETPNIDAHGHACFGAGWRGLHPPHHLQVFSITALREMLDAIGFIHIRSAPWQPNWHAMATLSQSQNLPMKRVPFFEELVAYRDRGKTEFITFLATAPA